MIDSDILPSDKILPDIVIIDALKYLPNIFYLNIIDPSIPEPPNTHKEAIQRTDAHKWIEAMKVQYSILIKNKTWKQIDRELIPKRHKIHIGRWVYIYKRDGTYKAR
jgi:hypothetical protein